MLFTFVSDVAELLSALHTSATDCRYPVTGEPRRATGDFSAGGTTGDYPRLAPPCYKGHAVGATRSSRARSSLLSGSHEIPENSDCVTRVLPWKAQTLKSFT